MELTQLGWNAFFEAHFSEFREQAYLPARIVREDRHVYLAHSEQGELAVRVSGRLRHAARGRSDFPAVGDWVVIEPLPSEAKGVVHAVLPRKSAFLRKVVSVKTEEQVVAANVDTVFLVNGLDGDFNLRRMERYLTLAWESGAKPVIILNKADLCADIESHVTQAESATIGVAVQVVSAVTGRGLDGLRQYLGTGDTAAMLGSSGVGKSSIINRLLGTDSLPVGAVRERDGKGRHITTSRQLLAVPGGGLIMDTPGLREIQLWAHEDGLEGAFADIEELAARCRFRDCEHKFEPGCAVKAAIESGEMDEKRLRSYLKLQREIRFLAIRKDQRARMDERSKWKKIAIQSRQRRKHEWKP